MATPTAQTSGADLMLGKIKGQLDIMESNLTAKIVAENHALKVQIDALRQEMVTLQSIVAGSKKTTAAKPAAAKTGETVVVAADAAVAEVAKAPFPTTIPAWFCKLYKDTTQEGIAFRAKYLNEAMLAEMNKDTVIAGKKNAEVKVNSEARFCHQYLKANNKALTDQFALEYKTAKALHEAAAKPTQQVAEPTTPPNGTVTGVV